MNDSAMGLELELGIGSDTSLPVVDEAQLTDAIRVILQDADLEQLSRRMIRKQLETQFHMDLSHYKDTINATILELIEQQNQQQEEGDEDDDDEEEDDDDDDEPEPSDDERQPPKKKAKKAATTPSTSAKKKVPAKRKRSPAADGDKKMSNAFNMELSVSPELAAVVGSHRMARPQIVKALWEYIREHELQDPTNKRHILLDDRLRSVFQRESFTMFSMNKYVKRHVRKPAELPASGWADIHRDGVSSDDDAEAKPSAKKKATPAKRKKKASSPDDDDDSHADATKPKRANPFNTELALSPELAAVVGSHRMSRPQIVKALWEYIHAHELQDPADKRTILLDNTLRQVFQRDSVTMFSMNKYIKRHARKPEDVPAGGWAAVPRDGLSSDEDESKKTPKKKPAKKGGRIKTDVKDE